jgi:hypothetical protein
MFEIVELIWKDQITEMLSHNGDSVPLAYKSNSIFLAKICFKNLLFYDVFKLVLLQN